MSFKKRLKGAASTWKAGKERDGGGFEDMADGYYVCGLRKAEVRESEAGNLGFMITYRVLDGDNEGDTIVDWNSLEHEVSINILCKKLGKLGVGAPDDIEDLEDTALELEEIRPRVRLKLKSRKSGDRVFQGKDVDRLLGTDDEDDDEAPAPKSGSKSKSKSKPDPEPEPEEDDAFEKGDFGKGDKVAVFAEEDGDDDDTGVVTEVRDDTLVVVFDGDDEEDAIEVEFEEISEIIEKAPEPKKKRGGRRKAAKPDPEPEDEEPEGEDEEPEEDEVDLVEGMHVEVDGMGECVIEKLDEKAGLVTVKPIAGGRKKRVSPDILAVIPAAAQDDTPPKRGGRRRANK